MFDHNQADPAAIRGFIGFIVGIAVGFGLWALLYFAALGIASLLD